MVDHVEVDDGNDSGDDADAEWGSAREERERQDGLGGDAELDVDERVEEDGECDGEGNAERVLAQGYRLTAAREDLQQSANLESAAAA